MLNTKYNTLADLKTAYKEADRDRKKRDYDAMKKAKREAKPSIVAGRPSIRYEINPIIFNKTH